MKTSPSMKPATRAAIASILDMDGSLSPAHRARILAACDSPSDPPPDTASPGMTATEAAQYLGVHPATVGRWIQDNKLEATKHAGRFILSPESVESLRADLRGANGSRPVQPLPERLGHLAAHVKAPAKRSRKARRN